MGNARALFDLPSFPTKMKFDIIAIKPYTEKYDVKNGLT